jgi:serine protease Do
MPKPTTSRSSALNPLHSPALRARWLPIVALAFASGVAVSHFSASQAQAPAAPSVSALPAPATSPSAGVARVSAQAGLPDFADLADRVSPAVVNVRTRAKAPRRMQAPPDFDLFRYFGIPAPGEMTPQAPRRSQPQQGRPGQTVPLGSGSGFIVGADGYILTNAHVVDGADEVVVRLLDKREFKAKVVGADERSDVALLKIDADKLPTVKLAEPGKVRAGEWVIAIGSPFNLENTVTAGIVSAKARDTGELVPLIQTDVAINPGNSGGPLINMRGEVIGINSQIYSRSGGYMGISFAIPIEEAQKVADQLKSGGRVHRGRIGVALGELRPEVAESMGLDPEKGAVALAQLQRGGPAAKAGAMAGDVVLKANGIEIHSMAELQRVIFGTPVGQAVNLVVLRQGKQRELKVVVQDLDGGKPQGEHEKAAPGGQAERLGLQLQALSASAAREAGLSGGVWIAQTQGPARQAGLQRGDIILAINNESVESLEAAQAVLAKRDPKRPVQMMIKRGEWVHYVVLSD